MTDASAAAPGPPPSVAPPSVAPPSVAPAASAPVSKGQIRTLECPNCGGAVRLAANGISITAVCGSCGGVLDVANEQVRLIAEAERRTVHPPIPLGRRGTLAGVEWEVIGFQIRDDADGEFSWNEYLLFNPYHGFRFLAQDDEDWTLYCMLREAVTNPEAGFDGMRYKQLSRGTARTTYVMGEFYWRVRAGDEAYVSEYASGRHVLSCERNGTEIVWSRGLRLPEAEIDKAFSLDRQTSVMQLSRTSSKTAQAPSRSWTAPRVGIAAIVVLLLLHAIGFGTSRSLVLFDQTFHTTSADKGRTFTSEPFTVPSKGGNLMISAVASVDNNWVQLNCSLVDQNNVRHDTVETIEYYHGYDSDGSWSEGAKSTSTTFASVPGGTYRLLIEPDAGLYGTASSLKNAGGAVDFTVRVTRHVPSTWNFILALLLLLPWPIWCWYRGRSARGTSTHRPIPSPAR